MSQLPLDFGVDQKWLQEYLEKTTGKTVSLVITDNTSSMLSFRSTRGRIALRLHRMFLYSGRDVLDELAEFMKNKRKKTPLVSSYIVENLHIVREKPPRKIRLQHQGKVHNLIEIFESINEEYFSRRIKAVITWGAYRPRRAAARKTLGSFSLHGDIVRINPALDSKRVPRYFLEYIVYHEMLHADMGIQKGKKRHIIHSKEFKQREKLFKHYERAIAWEKRSL